MAAQGRREDVQDVPRCGQPKTQRRDANVDKCTNLGALSVVYDGIMYFVVGISQVNDGFNNANGYGYK
jgi:hypothetical protein